MLFANKTTPTIDFSQYDPDILNTLKQDSSSWTYDLFDAEDMQRKAQGLMPKSLADDYDLDDPIDKALYESGYVSRKNFSKGYQQAERNNASKADFNTEVIKGVQAKLTSDPEKTEKQAFDEVFEELRKSDSYKGIVKADDKDAFFKQYAKGSMQSKLADAPNEFEVNASDWLNRKNGALGSVGLPQMGKTYTAGRMETKHPELTPVHVLTEADFEEAKRKAEEARKEEKGEILTSAAKYDESSEARADEIDKRVREINRALNRTGGVQQAYINPDKRNALLEERNALQAELGALHGERSDIIAGRNASALAPFYKTTKAADFAQNSEYDPSRARTEDILYSFINGQEPAQTSMLNPMGINAPSSTSDPDYAFKYLTDEERGIYNYLVNTGGDDKAFLEAVRPYANERMRNAVEAEARAYAEDRPVLSSLQTIATSPVSAIEGLIGLGKTGINAIAGRDTDPNDPVFQNTRKNNAIRETVGNTIKAENQGFVGEALAMLYQTGMSMGDTAVRLPMGAAGLGVAGLSAAASAMDDALSRGATSGQALASGLVNGAAEVVFEKAPLDNLVSMSHAGNIQDVVKNILKQGGVEASEEVFTEIANTISDAVIMADKSAYEIAVRDYMANGMTEQVARQLASMDSVKAILDAGIGGFISGGTFGTGGQMMALGQTALTGRAINNAGMTESVVAEGFKSANAEARAQALRTLQKPTALNVGRQYYANVEAEQQRRRGAFERDISGALAPQDVSIAMDLYDRMSDGRASKMLSKELSKFAEMAKRAYDRIQEAKAEFSADATRIRAELSESYNKMIDAMRGADVQAFQEAKRSYESKYTILKAQIAAEELKAKHRAEEEARKAELELQKIREEEEARYQATLRERAEIVRKQQEQEREIRRKRMEAEEAARRKQFEEQAAAQRAEREARWNEEQTNAALKELKKLLKIENNQQEEATRYAKMMEAIEEGNPETVAKAIAEYEELIHATSRIDEILAGNADSIEQKLGANAEQDSESLVKAYESGNKDAVVAAIRRNKAQATRLAQLHERARKAKAEGKDQSYRAKLAPMPEMDVQSYETNMLKDVEKLYKIEGKRDILEQRYEELVRASESGDREALETAAAAYEEALHASERIDDTLALNEGYLYDRLMDAYEAGDTDAIEKALADYNRARFGKSEDVQDVVKESEQDETKERRAAEKHEVGSEITMDARTLEAGKKVFENLEPDARKELTKLYGKDVNLITEQMAAIYRMEVEGKLVIEVPDNVKEKYAEMFERIETGIDEAEDGEVTYHTEVYGRETIEEVEGPGLKQQYDIAELTENEREILRKSTKELSILDSVAKAGGVEIVMVRTIKGMNIGGHTMHSAPNGVYDGKNGKIYVALDAQAGAISYIAFHELTHYIKQHAKKSYGVLEKIVFDALGDAKARQLVSEQMQRHGYSADVAREEVLANAIPAILTDEQYVKQLIRRDSNLAGQIKKIIDAILDALTTQFVDLTAINPDFAPAADLEQSIETLRKMQKFFDAGLAEAAGNHKPQSPLQESRESRRYDAKYMQKAIEHNEAHGSPVPAEVMQDAANKRAEIAKFMNENEQALALPADVEGNTAVGNSSYGYSQENSTVCIRSLMADEFINAISERLGRPLTEEEAIFASQEAARFTDNPQCIYCYVAMDRNAFRAFLGKYLEQRDETIAKMGTGATDDQLYREFLGKRKPTNEMRKRFDLWMDAVRNMTELITPADLASDAAMQRAIERNPKLEEQINDAKKYAQSASWAKKRIPYRAYNNGILSWKDSRVRQLNRMFGMRMYSFSDFSPAFILENMQMFTDAAVQKLKVLAYTKDINFVKIFAPTNANINLSVYGYFQNGQVGEDAMQGAPWEESKRMREQYPNVGITFVATNDKLVEWALDQDWIDVVIPFHLVRTGKTVADMLGFMDYTKESGDKKTPLWRKGKDAKEVYPTVHQNDKAKYFAALKENNLSPRFERWVNHPNYMKLVNETRRASNASPAVQPIFDTEAAYDALDELIKRGGYEQHVGGSVEEMRDIANETAEKIKSGGVETFKRNVRASARTTRDAEYMTAVESGDMETAQRMVDEAAKAAGFTPVSRYHQTGERFTVFSNDNPIAGINDSDTPNGYFFKTNDHDIGVGADYVKTGRGGNVQMRVYLKAPRTLFFKNRKDAAKWYSENVPGYAKLLAEYDKYREEYRALDKKNTDAMFKELQELEDSGRSTPELDLEIMDKYDKVIDDWFAANEHRETSLRREMRSLLNKYFLENDSGYDAIELADDGHRYIDGKREDVHTFIVFKNTQIKSADPVTYDDNGRVIPLSERFNVENDDIRFSDRAEEPVSNQISQAAKIRAEAERLFKEGVTIGKYYETHKQNYSIRVARQLISIWLKDGTDVGGKLSDQKMNAVLQNSSHYEFKGVFGTGILKSLKANLMSPLRIFEQTGAWRKGDDARSRTMNYLEGEALKETFFDPIMQAGAEANLFMERESQLVKAKLEAIPKEDRQLMSSLVQLLGESVASREEAKMARYGKNGMLVRTKDEDGETIFVFNKEGQLAAMEAPRKEDGEVVGTEVLIFDDKFYSRLKESKKEIAKITGKNGKNILSDLDNAAIQEIQNRAKRNLPTILRDQHLVIYEGGKNVDVQTQGGKQLLKLDDAKSPDIDKVEDLMQVMRTFYSKVYEAQNKVLTAAGYRPIPLRGNSYFPHQGRETTSYMDSLVMMLEGESDKIPTEIVGKTGGFKPGKAFAAHLLARTGLMTEYDAIRGFNRYVRAASDIIYYTPAIQRLRQFENFLREQSKDERADIEGAKNNTLVAWLTEYANAIANKKHTMDRGGEALIGREAYTFTDKLTGLFGAASVAGNISTALSNNISLLTAVPNLDKKYIGKAARDAWNNAWREVIKGGQGDDFVEKIPLLARRFESYETLLTDQVKMAGRKVNDAMGAMFAFMDRFAVETAARAKYAELKAKGDVDAVRKTNEFLLKNFADRSKGMTPTIYNMRLLRLLTQFQLEGHNQLSHFRDMSRAVTARQVEKQLTPEQIRTIMNGQVADIDWSKINIKSRDAKEIASKLLYLLLLSLWGVFTRWTMGHDQTWNPAGMTADFVKAIGEEDVKGAFSKLGQDVLDQVPFIQTLTGGGRIPAFGGIQNVADAVAAIFDKDSTGDLAKITQGAAAFVPGGAQISKTIRGIDAYTRGGSYSGKGNLRYPVEQTAGNFVRSALFGPASNQPQGWDYLTDTLSEKKTAAYEEAVEAGANPTKAYETLKDYGGDTNAAKLTSLAEADVDEKTRKLIAKAMGLTLGEGSIKSQAKAEAKEYLEGKEKQYNSGKITKADLEAADRKTQDLIKRLMGIK